ncbi:hypothetical protein MILUP08_43521 [Micromonospora lupini str. Lupac 08]|uniref:Uncharacterized protein n=1 Tax=Micromonospora lupini str. Lupac 08 TaxID=1150864 RepID=I0L464_9ACTN|nr:hypothetical protein MILUP08_43521 [Micromonospora lupini str. Lupac 08]
MAVQDTGKGEAAGATPDHGDTVSHGETLYRRRTMHRNSRE